MELNGDSMELYNEDSMFFFLQGYLMLVYW